MFILRKKIKNFPFLYSKKNNQILENKAEIFKNLINFFKIGKSKWKSIESVIGIKFSLEFGKQLNTGIAKNQMKLFSSMLSKKSHISRISPINSMIRYNGKKNNLKTFFFKNFVNKKNYSTKIFIEETSDEIKTYLDENLIELILKQNQLYGRCWLWIKFSPENNKNYWFELINSCFNCMTNNEIRNEKTWAIKNLNSSIEKICHKDYEFEFSKFSGKKNTACSCNDNSKNYKSVSRFISKYTQSPEIYYNLINLNWRNRIFFKKKIHSSGFFNNINKISHSSQLLLY
jgi:hypothetical protein